LGLRSGLPRVLVVSVLVVSVPEELVLVVSVLGESVRVLSTHQRVLAG